MTSDQLRAQVEPLLYRFGEVDLKPSEDYLVEATRLGQKVFDMLKMSARATNLFTVPATHFAGSIGKKTNVITPDLDLVIVVNDLRPPFTELLEEFQKLLKANCGILKIWPNSFKKFDTSIYFKFINGIEVDLLPAANLTPGEVYELLQSKATDDQYRKVYNRLYGSSLVAEQLGFVSSQSSFTHVVIRLAKLWFKSLDFGREVFGGSTILELLGTVAAENVEATYRDPHALTAMDEVLSMVANLSTLRLAFRKVGEGKWERVPQNQLGAHSIPGVVGAAAMLDRQCFIIEPANPFNDLLEDKDDVMIEKFMNFAIVTKVRFANLRRGQYIQRKTTNMGEGWKLNTTKLFKPLK